MEGTAGRVDNATLAEESVVLQLVTEEGTRDVQLLAADDNDALTGEGLLGNNGGEATQEMAFTVDDNHLNREENVFVVG